MALEGAGQEAEIGGIKVKSIEEAKSYEAQGFLTADEVKIAENQFQKPGAKEGIIEKARKLLGLSPRTS